MHPSRPSTLACLLALIGLLPVLAGCGLAGLEDAHASKPEAGTTAALEITTSELPDAKVEGTYPPTQLVTSGELAPVTWRLTAGELPPGLTLSTAGVEYKTDPEAVTAALVKLANETAEAANRVTRSVKPSRARMIDL